MPVLCFISTDSAEGKSAEEGGGSRTPFMKQPIHRAAEHGEALTEKNLKKEYN